MINKKARKNTAARAITLEANKIQHAFNKYLREKGVTNGVPISKTKIIRAFSENEFIKGAYYIAEGEGNDEKLMDLANKLWKSEVPSEYRKVGSPAKKRGNKKKRKALSGEFLMSYEWRKLRYQAILLYGKKCMCCGDGPDNGAILNVDHVKPRKLYPELSLEMSNLQVLCGPCNHGKGNWDQTDHRA